MKPVQPGPRLPEGLSVARSGTLRKDLKGCQVPRTKGMLEAMGVRGHRERHGGNKAGVGNPQDGLVPGCVVSHSCSFPACSHGTG